MGFACKIGGARVTFEGALGGQVAGALDQAFGAEGDWEGVASRHFGQLTDDEWSALTRRAVEELGQDRLPNLLALGSCGQGVFLPANVHAMSLPLPTGPLRCAALPGLRSELAMLAELWEVPVDDRGLLAILEASELDEGSVADAPEVIALARVGLAANEALRRDCPLWLVGGGDV